MTDTIKKTAILFMASGIFYLLYAEINPTVFINPGIKIGYQFGAKEGFVFGPEFSVGYFAGNGGFGPVVGMVFGSNIVRFEPYAEFEIGTPMVGYSLGISPNEFYQRIWFGFIGYASYKFHSHKKEISIIPKLPFLLNNQTMTM